MKFSLTDYSNIHKMERGKKNYKEKTVEFKSPGHGIFSFNTKLLLKMNGFTVPGFC